MTYKPDNGSSDRPLAIIDGPCGATGNNPKLATFDEHRRLMRKTDGLIFKFLFKLLGR